MSKKEKDVDVAKIQARPAVYVAGKLNDDAVGYLTNVHNMMEWAEKVRRIGASPFIPAIDLLMGIKFGYTNYHDYFDPSQSWLSKSDAIFVCPGWETSSGTKKEIELAESLEIEIFYDFGELEDWVDNFRHSVMALWQGE